MKKTIEKEHRVLDDTDLNIIDNTFKDIKHDFNNTFKEIKHDNNNNFNRIDNTFKLFKSELQSTREEFKSELQSSRVELQSTREELKYSRDGLNGKLTFILWFIGVGFAILGLLIKTS